MEETKMKTTMTTEDKEFHKGNLTHEASHCVRVAKSHQALVDHLAISDPVASGHHAALVKAFTDRAEHCVGCCDKIEAMETSEKAADHGPADKTEGAALRKLQDSVDLLLRQTIPSSVSVFPRTANPTLVPRAGQRGEAEAIQKSGIAPELANIVFDESQA
jgi:hypothetical protein